MRLIICTLWLMGMFIRFLMQGRFWLDYFLGRREFGKMEDEDESDGRPGVRRNMYNLVCLFANGDMVGVWFWVYFIVCDYFGC
jgi:hypothetical protein